MKEQFVLFKSGETKNWTQKLISPFLALILQKTKESKQLFLKEQKERFALFCQKTSDSHEKPKSELPTLISGVEEGGDYVDISGGGGGAGGGRSLYKTIWSAVASTFSPPKEKNLLAKD